MASDQGRVCDSLQLAKSELLVAYLDQPPAISGGQPAGSLLFAPRWKCSGQKGCWTHEQPWKVWSQAVLLGLGSSWKLLFHVSLISGRWDISTGHNDLSTRIWGHTVINWIMWTSLPHFKRESSHQSAPVSPVDAAARISSEEKEVLSRDLLTSPVRGTDLLIWSKSLSSRFRHRRLEDRADGRLGTTPLSSIINSGKVKIFSCQSSSIPTYLTDWVSEWVSDSPLCHSERLTRQCAHLVR